MDKIETLPAQRYETVALLMLLVLMASIVITAVRNPTQVPHTHDGGKTFHVHPGVR